MRRWLLVCVGLALACQAPFGPRRASEAERAAYREALAERSPERLREFLTQHPQSALADDALYQLAELQLAGGDADGAAATFEELLRLHPGGNRVDAARYRLGRIELERGRPEVGYRVAAGIRLSRLPREERVLAERLLADLAHASGDLVMQLRWLAQLHGESADENERALVETEIDELVLEMDSSQLRRAAEQAGKRVPAARLRLRLAELAVASNEPRIAAAELDRVRRLPLTPFDERRLYELEVRLGLRPPEARLALPPRLTELSGLEARDLSGVSGTLGVVLPLTGPYARFGDEALRGLLLAAGIFGDAAEAPGRVHLSVRDSAGTAEGAAAAVEVLAGESEVRAIVGPLAVREAVGAARAAWEEGVPLVALSRPEQGGDPNPWTLRLGLAHAAEAQLVAEFATRELGAQRFAVLYPEDDYGRSLSSLFWDAVEERGGVLVGAAGYDPEATDFSESIRRLVGFVLLTPAEEEALRQRSRLLERAKRLPTGEARALRDEAAALTGPDGRALPPIVDFDALYIPDSYENVVLIAPQLAFHEVTGFQLLGTDGWNDAQLVRIGDRHVEGAVFTALYHRELPYPFSYDFARRYEETFGTPPASFAALGFDAATLVLSRWAEGATSREEVVQELRALHNVPALTGVLSVDPDGAVVRRPHLLTVERGRITSLD